MQHFSVAEPGVQMEVHLTKESELPGSIPGPEHTLVEIDYEIFCMIISSLPLTQEQYLSVTGESMGKYG